MKYPISRSNAYNVILGLCVLYCLVFTFLYIVDPLAQAPQLDAKENLILAGKIDQHTLSPEPFYRAMLYPALLSLFHPVTSRPVVGLLFGLACHLLNGWLVFRLSRKVWEKPAASYLSSSLYLLNPASLFFSLQLLDITFAVSLFLGGILMGLAKSKGRHESLLAGLLLGLAALARPHFLPVVLMGPVIFAIWPGNQFRISALAWIPILALLLFQGLVNYQHSGEFRILPWQGSYNLWAANRPGANGLYFKQVVDVSGRGDDMNPAKAESIILFTEANPEVGPSYDIDEMNDFWKNRFVDRLIHEPASLVRLWIFKAYATINSYEQYNNLTFSYHKDRLPLLRINLLNWGIIFLVGLGGFVILFKVNNRKALVFAALSLCYVSTLLIYYASARFRLPLVPVLAILSGGAVWIPKYMKDNSKYALSALILVLFGGFLTFSSIGGIRNQDTYLQDQMLLANANADLGRDAEAARIARSVLALHPQRTEAQRIYTVSYFNMRLLVDPAGEAFGDWMEQKSLVIQSPPTDPVQDTILGIYFWKWGQKERALSTWEKIAPLNISGSTLAEACLRLTHEVPADPENDTPLDQALRPILIGLPPSP